MVPGPFHLIWVPPRRQSAPIMRQYYLTVTGGSTAPIMLQSRLNTDPVRPPPPG
jgi:hypothetical protein